jgi:solute carrier family 25 carnitine/acylcarnitine transporter 20/29
MLPAYFDSLIAGSISGSAGVVVCHPFDVIRTQIQSGRSQRGVINCFKDIIREHGVGGFYTGLLGPFFAQAVYKSVIFTTNSAVSKFVFTGEKSNQTIFLSGLIAGSVNAFIVAPVELLRTRQILSGSKISFHSTFQTLITEGGVRGLFRGLFPAILRDGPGIGAYFLTFDTCKKMLSHNSTISSNNPKKSYPNQVQASPPLWVRLLSASLAGVSFWVIALPIDTAKTILESSPIKKDFVSQVSYLFSTIQQRGGMVKSPYMFLS